MVVFTLKIKKDKCTKLYFKSKVKIEMQSKVTWNWYIKRKVQVFLMEDLTKVYNIYDNTKEFINTNLIEICSKGNVSFD